MSILIPEYLGNAQQPAQFSLMDVPSTNTFQSPIPTPKNKLDALFVTTNQVVNAGGSNSPVADFLSNMTHIHNMDSGDNLLTAQSRQAASMTTDELANMITEGYIDPVEAKQVSDYVTTQGNSPELAIEEGIGSLTNTPEKAAEVKSSYKIAQALDEIGKEKEGWFTVGKEYAKSVLIPGRDNFLANELIGSFGMGSYDKFVSYYRSLPEDKKAKATDSILAKMKTVDGYWLEKQGVLTDLISLSSNSDIQTKKIFQYIDAATVGIDGLGAAKAGKRLLGALVTKTDPIAVLNSAGNTKVAGQLNAAAIKDPALADNIGADRDLAMLDLFPTERTQKVINTTGANANATLDALSSGTMYNPENVNKFRQETIDSLKNVDTLSPELFTAAEKTSEARRIAKDRVNEVKKQYSYQATTQPTMRLESHPTQPNRMIMHLDYEGSKDVYKASDTEVNYEAAKKLLAVDTKQSTAVLAKKLGVSVADAKELRTMVKTGKKDPKSLNIPKGTTTKVATPHKETIEFDLDDTVWDKMEKMYKDDHVFGGMGTSPKMQFRSLEDNSTTVNRIVEDYGLVMANQNKLREVFAKSYTSALNKANKGKIFGGGQKKVEKALSDSDANNKLFKPLELETKYGMNKNQIDSYYQINELLDIAKDISDFRNFKIEKLRGTKEANLGSSTATGKVFDTLDGNATKHLESIGMKQPKRYYDPETGLTVRAEDLDAYLAKNTDKRLFFSQSDHVTSKGDKFRAMIVPASRVSDVTPATYRSLGREGYVPIIRPNAKYIVEEVYTATVDGNAVTRTRTIGGGSTQAEQEAIAAARRAEINSGAVSDVKDSTAVRKRYDREGGSPDADEGNSTNRVFTGARAQRDLVWSQAADQRLSPRQAIAKNLDFVSNSFPAAEWRVAMLERWKNSVRASSTAQARSEDLGLHTPIDITTSEGRVLEAQRKYLAGVMGLPEDSVYHWEGLTRKLSEKLDMIPKIGNPAGRALRRVSTNDPIAAIKYFTFHSLLGWFNPAQLIVQASNMTLVASVHPWLTARHFNKIMGLRTAIHLIDRPRALAWVAKRSGIGEELIDIAKQFRRIGGTDMQLNADFGSALNGFGTTRSAFNKAAQAGLIPYYHGELSARSTAYVVAREKIMRDRKITDWKKLTNDDHRLINDYYKNLSLNLGKENQAGFQRGLASTATQFVHVQTKYIESFFGKKFTTEQKVRMFLGQVALFGAAGVPFGDYLAEKYAGMTADDENRYNGMLPEQILRQGLTSILAGDVDLAKRLSLNSGIGDTLLKLTGETDDSAWQLLLGASGTMLDRGSYAWNMTYSFLTYPEEINDKTFMNVLSSWAAVTSTWNNADKALAMYYTDKFMSKNSGKILFDSPTNQEIMSKALGFQSVRENQVFEMTKDLGDRDEYIQNLANKFLSNMLNNGDDPYSVEYSDKFRRHLEVWARMFTGDDENMLFDLQGLILKRLANAETTEERALAKIYKDDLSRQLNPIHVDKARDAYTNTGE